MQVIHVRVDNIGLLFISGQDGGILHVCCFIHEKQWGWRILYRSNECFQQIYTTSTV